MGEGQQEIAGDLARVDYLEVGEMIKPGLSVGPRTRQMNEVERSTAFSLYIREIPELISKNGYRASNVDFVWAHEPLKLYLLLEEKRFGCSMPDWQDRVFRYLDAGLSQDPNYRGFHVLVLEQELPLGWREHIRNLDEFLARFKGAFNREPAEGKMRLDGREIALDELIHFLSFQADEIHYRSFCDPQRYEEFEQWER
jgi:hypothetical protein